MTSAATGQTFTTDRRRVILGAGAAMLATSVQAGETKESDILETGSGKVRGYRESGVQVFKGIPYGSQTRFLAPQPPLAWTGVREAMAFGASCAQLTSRGVAGGEDCLSLSIWTPGAQRNRKRPVMVDIHGGGFRTGSGSIPSMDGAHLALSEDVVIVNVNHRLGPLGYLYLGDLLGSQYEIGNAGNLDLVLALEWVRDNIAAFGGDPGNVTVFGVSGGGKKISHLLAMPSAKGLFHRAIVMSGALSTAIERAAATAYTERLIGQLGLARADDILTMPVEPMLTAVAALSKAGLDPEGGYGGGGGPQPLVDGHTLPRHPGEALHAGMSSHIPTMIGSALDEPIAGYPGPEGLAQLRTMSWDTVRKRLADGLFVKLGASVEPVLVHYRTVWPDLSPGALMVRIETAGSWRLLSNQLADHKAAAGRAPTWVYVMTFAGGTPGGPRGAGHGTDIPLLLGNLEQARDTSPSPWFAESPDAARVSRMMGKTWAQFARTGNPNNPLLPRWPAYTRAGRETMMLDTNSQAVGNPFGDREAFA